MAIQVPYVHPDIQQQDCTMSLTLCGIGGHQVVNQNLDGREPVLRVQGADTTKSVTILLNWLSENGEVDLIGEQYLKRAVAFFIASLLTDRHLEYKALFHFLELFLYMTWAF